MVLALAAIAGLIIGWQARPTQLTRPALGVILALTVGLQTAVLLFAPSPADITLLPAVGGALLLAGTGTGVLLRQARRI